MRVVRVYHAGRDPAHRMRDRALTAAGVELLYVVPSTWPEQSAQSILSPEQFRMVELPVLRAGDVNRHRYRDASAFARIVREFRPDVVDLCEEPFSAVAHQLLRAVPPRLPIVMYSAQNLDKRWPPPFAQWERAAFRRVHGFYPCSRQAASVLRGKGYGGLIQPLPLGYDPDAFRPGAQAGTDAELSIALVGRMVPEKGVLDAVRIFARVCARRRVRLLLVGHGREVEPAMALARALEVDSLVQHLPWQRADQLADLYRRVHIVLAPSRATATWVEQFGRMIVEGQASGCVLAGYASGAIPEVGDEAALLASEGDWEALADGILELLDRPTEFAARREQGIRAAAPLSWERIARRQLAFFEAAAGRSPGPLLVARPETLRTAARAEYGHPASTPRLERPFALPLLRAPSALSRAIARFIDRTAGLKADAVARLRSSRG